MNELRTASLRNVAVIGSRGAGKTSLTEALLFCAGVVSKLGTIAQGSTVSDFEPEEQHHRTSVSTGLLRFTWNQTIITLLDTPGSLSLLGEPLTALEAADAVVVVLNPDTGIRSELIRLWARVRERQLPCLLFVNEADNHSKPLAELLAACQRDLDISPVPMTLPLHRDTVMEGVVDLFAQTVIRSKADSPKCETGAVPDTIASQVTESVKRLQEAVADMDDQLLEQYLSAGELTTEQLATGIRIGVHKAALVPLYRGSAVRNVGVASLLAAIKEWLPSPEERPQAVPPSDAGQFDGAGTGTSTPHHNREYFSGFIFKTLIDPFVGRLSYVRIVSGILQTDSMIFNGSRQIKEKCGHLYTMLGKKHTAVASAAAGEIVAVGKLKDAQTGDTLCEERDPVRYAWAALPRPVLSFAVEPKSGADIDKVSLGLHKLIEEDPTLDFSRNADTKEMVLSGMGQLHLDLALEKLQRKYGAEVVIHTPKIPYRETIRATAQAQGKFKKQTGGHGQYGDCWLEIAPAARGAGFSFENRIVGGAIPRNFVPAVEKGVVEAMHHGTLAGFPVVDLRVAVYDGSYHVVDSSEMSFKIAASMAFKKAMEIAHPVLLEPVMRVEIDAPADHIGAVIGDLNARRGRIQHVESRGHTELLKALVPLSELMTYTTVLNALTGGGGSYVMELARYEEVPREISLKVLEEQKAARQTVAASG